MDDINLIDLNYQHLELVRNWRNSTEVSKYMYSDHIISEEDQKRWFERILVDKTCKYWVIEFSGKLIGLASITNINTLSNSCFWGFYLGDSSIRGAGIGSKIEYNVLKYVFEDLKLNKLRGEVFVFNESVIRMHEKFGFRREAYYRQHVFKDGAYRDVVGIALLKSEWDLLKDSLYKRIYLRKKIEER